MKFHRGVLDAHAEFGGDLADMQRRYDSYGNPLPDDQPVGWVYVTNGDFRSARAALRRKP